MTNEPTDKSSTPPSSGSAQKQGSELVNDIFASMAKGSQPMAPDQLDPNPTRGRTFILGRNEASKDESEPAQNKGHLFARYPGQTYIQQKAEEIHARRPELTIEEIEDELM